jgi:uridine kinase
MPSPDKKTGQGKPGAAKAEAAPAPDAASSKSRKPLLVAIVGGSGAGKTWLADQLEAALGPVAGRLSLDDFYRDRSGLPAKRREKINFDHPRAIDWRSVEGVVRDCAEGRETWVPEYDFKTHSCRAQPRKLSPRPVILMDGLWLLRRPALRRLFNLRIFIRCPSRTRLGRRLARDLRSRGRTRKSIRQQFLTTVEPMHDCFVAPQERWADVVLDGHFGRREIDRLVNRLKACLAGHDWRPASEGTPEGLYEITN